jgi:hypothetical protein
VPAKKMMIIIKSMTAKRKKMMSTRMKKTPGRSNVIMAGTTALSLVVTRAARSCGHTSLARKWRCIWR